MRRFNRTGAVIGGINQRKGTIVDTEIREEEFSLVCEVSLNEMFGCEFSRLTSTSFESC